MKKNWVVLLIMTMTGACVGDEFNTDKLSDDLALNQGVALPLVHVDITMKEVFSNFTDMVKYYSDENGAEHIMLFQETDSTESVDINDFFQFSGVEQSVPIPFFLFNSQNQIAVNGSVPFVLSNADVTKLRLAYTLKLSASNFPQPVKVTLFFESVNSSVGGRTIIAELNGNDETLFTFDNDEMEIANQQIPMAVKVELITAGGSSPNVIGNLTIQLNDFHLKYAKGSMSETVVPIEKTELALDFDVFNNFSSGIEFDNPKFRLYIHNSTPFNGLIDMDVVGDSDEGQTVNLVMPTITMPACPANQEVINDTTTLTKSNSNIVEFFSNTPNVVTYEGDLVLNLGSSLTDVIELEESDKIYVGHGVEIPLEIILNTTFDVDTLEMDQNDVLDNLNKAKLVINAVNGFPLAAEATIIFYSEATNGIIETITAPLIHGALVDNNGFVREAVVSVEEVELTKAQISKLKETDKLIFRIKLQSTDYENTQVVVLLTDYQFSMQINLKGEVEF